MLKKLITVIDVDIGNVNSVAKALKHLKVDHIITKNPDDILKADKIIFPGVGSFFEASKRIKESGIKDILKERIIKDKIPILGICLGMQLLATTGEEVKKSDGLDLIKGKVSLLRSSKLGLRLPHIGWNDVSFENFKLFDSIKNGSCFYFVHSYEMIPSEDVKVAYTNYGIDYIAAIQKDNILGVQFHPEKSQHVGLKLLKNFSEGIY
jgi:glutamine amidotransferase